MKVKLAVFLTIMLIMCAVLNAQAPTKMYWTEYYPEHTHGAWRADLDGSSQEQVCSAYYGFEGVAVDFQNSKMYLASPHDYKIVRADLDGSNSVDLITVIHPVDIALDLSAGKIYWTDYTSTNAVIKRANLDGSGVESITAHLGYLCDLQGITVDVPGGKIYWVERMDDVICRANLDGTGIQTILHCYDGVSNSWDVAVYGSTLYWTDAQNDNISKADLDGSNVVNNVVAGLNGPRFMAIDHTTGKMYWVSSGDNSIKRADVTGANLDTLVTGLSHPIGLSLNYNQNTLPVTLSTFTAQVIENTPTLYWETQSEIDNIGWNIYRNIEEKFSSSELLTVELIPGNGTTTEPSYYNYEDRESLNIGQTYYYWLESIDYGGIVQVYSRVVQITIPDPSVTPPNIEPPVVYDFKNVPNPVKGSAKFQFTLDKSSMVSVAIYNILGELVQTLPTVLTQPDEASLIYWNGKDSIGNELTPGVYFYNLIVNGKTAETKKLILMK